MVWKNQAGETHTSTADGGAWNTGNIPNGATSSPITVGALGSYGYHCEIHPSMVGTLTIVP